MRYLQVSMPDNSVWEFPCSIIAENRAKYYEGTGDDYKETYENTMNNQFELKDWVENNMNWDDVKEFAKKVEPENIDYQDGLVNGKKEVIEK